MVRTKPYEKEITRHSEDIQDIITKVPAWLTRWGISIFWLILMVVFGLCAIIRYPDIVTEKMVINSPNSPKPVAAKISGRITKLLVSENQTISEGQLLAYLETTASPERVLGLYDTLQKIRPQVVEDISFDATMLHQSDNFKLGELQAAFQPFYSEYLAYTSSINNGFLVEKKAFLHDDLVYIGKQQQQLDTQKVLDEKNLTLAEQEFNMHKKLASEKVESPAELRDQESKYLSRKSPLLQTEAALLTAANNMEAKKKELIELDHQIREEKEKFLQALNSLLSAIEDWKSKYLLTASQRGKITFAGVIQENQLVIPGQDVFYINPGNEAFFGEMTISQNNIGKVKLGQQVMIKLKGYPFEEYGMLRGTIKDISDVPFNDSLFLSKVTFEKQSPTNAKKQIHLKQGMIAEADIVTQDATVLGRLSRILFKGN